MTAAPGHFLAALDNLPNGTFTGAASGRRYIVTKSHLTGDRAVKLVAEELGGTDYISLNLYHLATGPRLYPCEMPLEKVIGFTCALVPDEPVSG